MKTHLRALFLGLIVMLGALPGRAMAGSETYVGEIGTFAFSFCPEGWMPLNGQVLPISQNEVLFRLLGTTFGGDGRSSFALPTAKPVFSADGTTTMIQCMATLSLPDAANPEQAATSTSDATNSAKAGGSTAGSATGHKASMAGAATPPARIGSLAQDPATYTGSLQAPAGSSTAPSVAVGSSSTGLYQPLANTLGIATSGCTASLGKPCVGPTVFDPNGALIIGALSRQNALRTAIEVNCAGSVSAGGTGCDIPFQVNEYIPNTPSQEPLTFFRSRGSSIGGTGIVHPGDNIGAVLAIGDDGTGAAGNTPFSSQVSFNASPACGPPSAHIVPGQILLGTMNGAGAFNDRVLTVECNGQVTASGNELVQGNLTVNGTIGGNGGIQSIAPREAVLAGENNTRPGLANENLASLQFDGFNAASQSKVFARIRGQVSNGSTGIGAGTEAGRINLDVMIGGALTTEVSVADQGVTVSGTAARKLEGVGTLNVTGPYYVSDKQVIDSSGNGTFSGLTASGSAVTLSGLNTTSGGNQPLCVDAAGHVYRGAGGAC